MNNSDSKPTHRPRWRFEFRLRSLFLLTTLIACPLGYIMYERHRCDQQTIILHKATSDWQELNTPTEIEQMSGISTRSGFWQLLLGDNSGDRITSLEIAGVHVSTRDLHALTFFPNLRSLKFRASNIEAAGVKHLARLHKLEKLDLRAAKIDDQGASHLANLTNLKSLYLQQIQITDNGVKHLSKLKNLEYLDLSDTLVTENALELLVQHQNLKLLALPPDAFSLEARTEIRKRLPNCDIIFARN